MIKSLQLKIQQEQKEQIDRLNEKQKEIDSLSKKTQEKERQIAQFKKRDEGSEKVLALAMEQEERNKELTKNYEMLDAEWQNMESYIRSLNDYQAQVEEKYDKML